MARVFLISCGLVLAIALMSIGVQGLSCYQCSCNENGTGNTDCKENPLSSYDNNCRDKTFGNETEPRKASHCSKVVFPKTVARSCEYEKNPEAIKDECVEFVLLGVKGEGCTCKKDSCNGAGNFLSSRKILATGLAILTAFFVAKY